MLTTDDIMIFGNDTLQPGTYALFTKPMKDKAWEVYIYNTENWGTPENWDDAKVAITNAMVTSLSNVMESFTISIDNVDMDAAELSFAWDKTRASVKFNVPTDERVEQILSLLCQVLLLEIITKQQIIICPKRQSWS